MDKRSNKKRENLPWGNLNPLVEENNRFKRKTNDYEKTNSPQNRNRRVYNKNSSKIGDTLEI